jgi:ATP-dependent protease HslVU (ClpYQ) peptidase subunit
MGKTRDDIQDDEVKKQDTIERNINTSMAENAGTTKESAEAQGVDAEQRHNLRLYEQLDKEVNNAKDPLQKKALEKMRDEAKQKAGIKDNL